MAKLLLLYLLAILSTASIINATTYMVGDTSGWDLSSDLNTWSQDNVLKVGDALVFMYSSYNSLSEVSKKDFDSCNTNNALKEYSNSNTTVPLSAPGDRFFVSGNQLYCYAGMKMQVHVSGNQAASPIGSPQAQPSATKTVPVQPSSKNNNPSAVVPTSSGISNYGSGINSLVVGFVVSLLMLLQA